MRLQACSQLHLGTKRHAHYSCTRRNARAPQDAHAPTKHNHAQAQPRSLRRSETRASALPTPRRRRQDAPPLDRPLKRSRFSPRNLNDWRGQPENRATNRPLHGGVAERLKAPVLKTGVLARVPWVRIPPPPPGPSGGPWRTRDRRAAFSSLRSLAGTNLSSSASDAPTRRCSARESGPVRLRSSPNPCSRAPVDVGC